MTISWMKLWKRAILLFNPYYNSAGIRWWSQQGAWRTESSGRPCYRGIQRDIPTAVVCDQGQRLRAKRVVVECYFGRLKLLWSVFSTTWKLDQDSFDLFFDLACAFTYIDILHRPLRESDLAFNEGILNTVLVEQEQKQRKQSWADIEYHERRRARLGIEPFDEFWIVRKWFCHFLNCFIWMLIYWKKKLLCRDKINWKW